MISQHTGDPQEPSVGALDKDQHNERYGRDFLDLRETLGLSDDPEDLWHGYVDGIARSVRCAPEVRRSLEELRGTGWTLGVTTNGAGDIQRAKLAATGLTSLFDGICISEETGARKPAYEHFEAAASLCGTRLSAGSHAAKPEGPHRNGKGPLTCYLAVGVAGFEPTTSSSRTRFSKVLPVQTCNVSW
ncbi:HAD family hydrolase [Streptomyces sp. NPDC003710]